MIWWRWLTQKRQEVRSVLKRQKLNRTEAEIVGFWRWAWRPFGVSFDQDQRNVVLHLSCHLLYNSIRSVTPSDLCVQLETCTVQYCTRIQYKNFTVNGNESIKISSDGISSLCFMIRVIKMQKIPSSLKEENGKLFEIGKQIYFKFLNILSENKEWGIFIQWIICMYTSYCHVTEDVAVR